MGNTSGRAGSAGLADYSIITAAPGIGRDAIAAAIRGVDSKAAVVDVDTELEQLARTQEFLDRVQWRTDRGAAPSTLSIATYLTPWEVKELWRDAAKNAILKLSRVEASARFLVLHSTRYSISFKATHCPVDSRVISGESERYRLRPRRLVLITDDVFDIYARLSRPGGLMALDRDERLQQSLVRAASALKREVRSLPRHVRSREELAWQTHALLWLLRWRELETVASEQLATSLGIDHLVWAVKQSALAVVGWASGQLSKSVYLSHPISRVREEAEESGSWPPLASEVNSLQELLASEEIALVMPSAIDEHRFRRASAEGSREILTAALASRWPLPTGETLYAQPDGGPEHAALLSTPGRAKAGVMREVDAVLAPLDREMIAQIASRDHFFVGATNAMFVYRPLSGMGFVSKGVASEILHWRQLGGGQGGRRAAFVHFAADIRALVARRSRTVRAHDIATVKDCLVDIVMEKYGVNEKGAKKLLRDARRGDRGILEAEIEPARRLASELSDLTKEARRKRLLRELRYYIAELRVEPEQVGVWVLENFDALRRSLGDIARFLRGECDAPKVTADVLDSFLEAAGRGARSGSHRKVSS